MEEQVAQKSSELEQYLQRVRELEDMYLQLQEALEDEKQARQDEETVRRLQARCQITLTLLSCTLQGVGALWERPALWESGTISPAGRNPRDRTGWSLFTLDQWKTRFWGYQTLSGGQSRGTVSFVLDCPEIQNLFWGEPVLFIQQVPDWLWGACLFGTVVVCDTKGLFQAWGMAICGKTRNCTFHLVI